jgi:hypothetical protein
MKWTGDDGTEVTLGKTIEIEGVSRLADRLRLDLDERAYVVPVTPHPSQGVPLEPDPWAGRSMGAHASVRETCRVRDRLRAHRREHAGRRERTPCRLPGRGRGR